MTKAEVFAMQEYPPVMVPIVPDSYESTDEVGKELKEVTVDANEHLRKACVLGYEQAIRDASEKVKWYDEHIGDRTHEIIYTRIDYDAHADRIEVPINVLTTHFRPGQRVTVITIDDERHD